MVFTLLVKVIALHVGPTAVDVRKLDFELVFISGSSLSKGLEKRLNDSI